MNVFLFIIIMYSLPILTFMTSIMEVFSRIIILCFLIYLFFLPCCPPLQLSMCLCILYQETSHPALRRRHTTACAFHPTCLSRWLIPEVTQVSVSGRTKPTHKPMGGREDSRFYCKHLPLIEVWTS